MTTEVLCCQRSTPLDEIRVVMRERRIRHLPVCDGDRRLVGLISIGDLNAHHVRDLETQVEYLQQYVCS